jgi:hypothetical protein
MTDSLKNALIGLLVAAIAMIAALIAWLQSPTGPVPEPSPSPSVVVSPTPVPFAELKLMRGMVDGFEMTAPEDAPAKWTFENVSIQAYEIREVETLIPSYKGARVGKYGDALMPVETLETGKRYWVDYTGLKAGTADIYVLGELVRVTVEDRDYKQPLPVYMEMQFAQVSKAHGLADVGTNFEQRVTLNKQYAALLRAHGVEPIKHAVTVYPNTTFNNNRWNELVLDNRIAAPCLFGPAPTLPPSSTLLQAIEAAIKAGTLPADSWAYAWDEGEGDATITQQALTRVNLIRQYAPSLKIMITRRPDPAFGNVIFTPVINWFTAWGSNGPGWIYTSCMANGNCTNKTSADLVKEATTFPMMVLDAPETDPERFVIEGAATGATALLYFNTTQKMPTAFDPGGQYNEGGNGDGTLLYPNGGVSKRLKYIRKGLNKLAWTR